MPVPEDKSTTNPDQNLIIDIEEGSVSSQTTSEVIHSGGYGLGPVIGETKKRINHGYGLIEEVSLNS